MKLENRVAIVTGASRGIGKATAILLAKEGAKIVVNYREKRENGKAVVNEIEESGGSGVLVQADVSNPADVKHLFQEAEKTFGPLTYL
jgi:NAD(P)-dependent dehydrogenase (short-subunit alcohol dehydrogenase family)